jgi:SHS2 domain-containing protein
MANYDRHDFTDNSVNTHDVTVGGDDIDVGVNFNLSELAKASKYNTDTLSKLKIMEMNEQAKIKAYEMNEQAKIKLVELNEIIKAKKGYYLIGITIFGIYLFKKNKGKK